MSSPLGVINNEFVFRKFPEEDKSWGGDPVDPGDPGDPGEPGVNIGDLGGDLYDFGDPEWSLLLLSISVFPLLPPPLLLLGVPILLIKLLCRFKAAILASSYISTWVVHIFFYIYGANHTFRRDAVAGIPIRLYASGSLSFLRLRLCLCLCLSASLTYLLTPDSTPLSVSISAPNPACLYLSHHLSVSASISASVSCIHLCHVPPPACSSARTRRACGCARTAGP